MQNSKTEMQKESPFWGILADAEEVQVREIDFTPPSGASPAPNGIDAVLKEFESNSVDLDRRAFLVRIKPNPIPKTEKEIRKELLHNTPFLLENAELLLRTREFVLARHLYAYILRDLPTETRALRGLGICLLKLGDLLASRKCFKALLDLSPSEENWFWIGQCYLTEGNDSLALHYFHKIAHPELIPLPERFDLYKEMGNCLTRMDRFEIAEVNYRNALQIDPQSDVVHVNLGTLELQRGRAPQALLAFEAALKLNPQNPKAHCGVGMALLSENKFEEAEVQLTACLDIDSQSTVALHQLLTIAHSKDDYGIVKERLNRFLTRAPHNADMRFALAAVLFREQEWAACEVELEMTLSHAPEHKKSKELLEEIRFNRHRS